jgi:hypothetical protein
VTGLAYRVRKVAGFTTEVRVYDGEEIISDDGI